MLVLGLSELLILMGSVVAAHYIVYGHFAGPEGEALDSLATRSTVFAGTQLAALVSMGLYHFQQRVTFGEVFVRVVVGLALGFLALAAIYFMLPGLLVGRRVSAFAAMIAVALILPTRAFFIKRVDENVFKRRTLVFGAGQRAKVLTNLRRKADRRGFKIVSMVPAPGDVLDESSESVATDMQSIAQLVDELQVDEVVIAMDDRRGNLPIRELLTLKLQGVEIIDIVEFLERESGKIRVDLLNPGWLVFSPGFRSNVLRRFEKRAVDLSFGLLIALTTWPIMILVAICIKLEDGLRAPVIYRQERVGLGGKVFEVLKFRSMIENAESDGQPQWATENDARITRVGSVLRKYRLDELPQVFNVIRGDMSVVGPRPERPAFVEELAESIPYYSERHSIKPGVTGWAQLRYSYGATSEDAIEKLQYDLYYVKNHNLPLDLLILLQTVEVVLWGKGAR